MKVSLPCPYWPSAGWLLWSSCPLPSPARLAPTPLPQPRWRGGSSLPSTPALRRGSSRHSPDLRPGLLSKPFPLLLQQPFSPLGTTLFWTWNYLLATLRAWIAPKHMKSLMKVELMLFAESWAIVKPLNNRKSTQFSYFKLLMIHSLNGCSLMSIIIFNGQAVPEL